LLQTSIQWWSSFPSIRLVIHPFKFFIPEEEEEDEEWRQQQFITVK
jgi:hypothetical protein